MVPVLVRAARRRLTAFALVGAAGVALAGCANGSPPPGVVAAVGAESQYANVIAQVGGRYVAVTSVIANPATDPHAYEASTSVARAVAGARLVVQNGLGYDAFMSQLESASASSSRRVLVAARLMGRPAATRNPHLWYDPATMSHVAAAVAHALTVIEPSHSAYFARRLRAFDAATGSLAAQIATFRSRFAHQPVAVTEPVANYLLAALGLRVVTPFRLQAAVMNGVDPSPQDVAAARAVLAGHAVRLLAYNAQVASPVTDAIRAQARTAGVPVVAFYETMPVGFTYQSWMRAEIAALTRALASGASTRSL